MDNSKSNRSWIKQHQHVLKCKNQRCPNLVGAQWEFIYARILTMLIREEFNFFLIEQIEF